MNRDRLEHEMSMNLDGRLPGGRRDELLAHIANDDDAAALWDEMEQAQELVLTLPQEQVGSGFSESLWERIRSGEGTPEAVFREPLPLATKARYVLTGAAAAAAVILGVHLLRPAELETRPEPVEQRIAMATAPEPRDDVRLTPAFRTVDPMSVARASRDGAFASVANLRKRLDTYRPKIDEMSPREIAVELEPDVNDALAATGLIRWMENGRIIQLPTEYHVALSITENGLQRIVRAKRNNDRTELRVAAELLQGLEVDRLRQDFMLQCCRSQEQFFERLLEQAQRNPRSMKFLKLRVVPRQLAGTEFRFEVDQIDIGIDQRATDRGGKVWILQSTDDR